MRLLEKAARAVATASGYHYRGDSIIVSAVDNPRSAHFVEIAKAVIASLADPDDDVCEAAYEAVAMDDRWRIEDQDHWKKSWRAALVAAGQE